ncbi:hypothetical protein KAI04_03425 [Candidatus Pacearchaeota archaeon]|nr:hypothetical protein [Candidatus Pacearchaeota archaeon]
MAKKLYIPEDKRIANLNEINNTRERYKLKSEKYLEILEYVKGIKGLTINEGEILSTFEGVEGQGRIDFVRLPKNTNGNIGYDKNMKFSEDNKLNEEIHKGLVDLLNE